MTRHLRDLTSTENLLVVSSRFWFKAHMFRCNTPLILLRDVFKSSNLSTSIRDFHSLMMAIAHMTKSKLSPNYQTPVTGVAEELLIKIIMLAQRGNDEQMNDIFSKYFFEGDANHFIQAANNLADDFLRNNFIIKSAVYENIFYQGFDRNEHTVN